MDEEEYAKIVEQRRNGGDFVVDDSKLSDPKNDGLLSTMSNINWIYALFIFTFDEQMVWATTIMERRCSEWEKMPMMVSQ